MPSRLPFQLDQIFIFHITKAANPIGKSSDKLFFRIGEMLEAKKQRKGEHRRHGVEKGNGGELGASLEARIAVVVTLAEAPLRTVDKELGRVGCGRRGDQAIATTTQDP